MKKPALNSLFILFNLLNRKHLTFALILNWKRFCHLLITINQQHPLYLFCIRYLVKLEQIKCQHMQGFEFQLINQNWLKFKKISLSLNMILRTLIYVLWYFNIIMNAKIDKILCNFDNVFVQQFQYTNFSK